MERNDKKSDQQTNITEQNKQYELLISIQII